MTCTEICGTFSCAFAWLDAHATAIVAAIAILFTFWQIRIARKHNELSVKPRLFIWIQSSINPGPRGGVIHTISAKNYGLGPAWIESIQYRVGGRLINQENANEVSEALHDVFPSRDLDVEVLFQQFGRRPYAIPKDGELALMAIKFAEPQRDDLDVIAANANLAIEYSWAYGGKISDSWPQQSRSAAA